MVKGLKTAFPGIIWLLVQEIELTKNLVLDNFPTISFVYNVSGPEWIVYSDVWK